MKKKLTLAFILLLGGRAQAQTFVDSTLNCLCKKMLVEGTSSIESDINYMGVIVMESKTGNILSNPICQIDNKAGLDSLKSAMLDIVKEGLGLKMKSFHTDVAGIANVSQTDVEGIRGCLAIAFSPYSNPQYTVGVYANKHGLPAGRNMPTRIVGNIINFMAEHYLEDKKANNMMSASEHKQERLRPYER